MRHIGLIGGLSPHSTIEYYRMLCTEYNRTAGGLEFPAITVKSVNLGHFIRLFNENRWDLVARDLIEALGDLKAAGAEFAAITANTPHNAFDEIRRGSPLELVSIMEATSAALLGDKIRKVGLLGTIPTMEYGFFQRHFEACGITTLTPEASDRKFINEVIWSELSHGQITDHSRREHIRIVRELVAKGAEGIILGCTELPLLVKPEDSSVPLYDTTKLHAQAILAFAGR